MCSERVNKTKTQPVMVMTVTVMIISRKYRHVLLSMDTNVF
jgi:hypothetical protein